jgi:pimeloyl-ACP methyl ester carboxylesterase
MSLEGDLSLPAFGDAAVPDGSLRVACWGSGERVVLGIHGITGSSVQLAPVAHLLDSDWRMIAPDLRGRGASNDLPGPFGVIRHAEDCAAVIEQFGGGPVVVLGESLGGFVAVTLAATRPDLVERLVLADGGLPTPVPADLDPDTLIRLVIGPAIDRLEQVFPTRRAYLDFWRRHPALGEEWNEDVEAYLEYDLEATEGGFRSRARKEAVREDGIDVLARHDLIAGATERVECPLVLVRACRNLVNAEPPLYPDEVVAKWRERLPSLEDELVADTNHYTLMFGRAGAEALAAHVGVGAHA